jgi:hypothetical protein
MVEWRRSGMRAADEIAAWYQQRGLDSKHGRGDYREPVWYVTWCFLNEADAEEFVSQFGGQLLGPELLSRRPAKRDRG